MPNLRRISHFGSSPHTRGALHLMSLDGEDYGIIPAYAGSTSSAIMSSSVREDHPRIRGEHMRRWRRAGRCRGSSPHTRGARGGVLVDVAGSGIIPAYAGSTVVAYTPYNDHGDHPRIRGEHRKMRAMAGNLKGSSPHTRGAPPWRQLVAERCGIIPAYAGSTAKCARWRGTSRDHPRIRGEHLRSCRWSSLNVRIIPAYAGSTRRHF